MKDERRATRLGCSVLFRGRGWGNEVGEAGSGPIIRDFRSHVNFEKTERQGIPRNLLKGTEQIRHGASLDSSLSRF